MENTGQNTGSDDSADQSLTISSPTEGSTSSQTEMNRPQDDASSMEAAEYVDELLSRAPTTEQSSRENAGNTRRPDDGKPSMLGVSDTDRAVPGHAPRDEASHDFTHRSDEHLPGENVETTGDERERQIEQNHL